MIRKHALTAALQGLVAPEVDATIVAGEMMDGMSRLWQEANLKERHKLLASMLEAVYIDAEARAVCRTVAKAGVQRAFPQCRP